MQCLCLFAPILGLAAPYVAYLWRHTGDLRLEGKGIMNYTIGERRNAGLGSAEESLRRPGISGRVRRPGSGG